MRRYAKFVYDAWTNPETLGIISKIAGVDLVPAMDYEIGHVNISVGDGEQGVAKAAPVVDWHFDSYPFVCVLMLSDASEMLGGETAIRTGGGEIIKVRGPQIVRLPILHLLGFSPMFRCKCMNKFVLTRFRVLP